MEKEVATHSSILAWKISWTEGCSPWGRKESGTTERLTLTSGMNTAKLHQCCWQGAPAGNKQFWAESKKTKNKKKPKSCIGFWPLKTSRMALCFPQMLWLDCSQVRKKASPVLLKEMKGLGSQLGNFCWSAQGTLVVLDLSEPQVSEESTKNTKHSQRNKELRICLCPAQKIKNQNLISLIFFPGFWEMPLPWRHQASLRIQLRNFDKNPLTCVEYSSLELSASVWNTLSLGHAMSKGMVWWEWLRGTRLRVYLPGLAHHNSPHSTWTFTE